MAGLTPILLLVGALSFGVAALFLLTIPRPPATLPDPPRDPVQDERVGELMAELGLKGRR